jgi:hypothetical protein
MKKYLFALLFAISLTACGGGGGGGGGGNSAATGIKPPTAVSTVSAN